MDFRATYFKAVSGLPREHCSRQGLFGTSLGLGFELNERDLRYLREAKVGNLKPYFSLHFNSTDFHRIRRGSIRSRIVVLLKQTFETISLWNNRLIVLALTTGWFFFMCYIITR